MYELFINGRYLLQRTTGVQRVAQELVAALDRRILAGLPTPRCTLLIPLGAKAPPMSGVVVRPVPGPSYPHLWEQWALPRAARGGLLLNLCGAAPAFGRVRQAVVVHDAAVFDHPEAYGVAFGAWYRWLFGHLARHNTRLLTVSGFSRTRLAAVLQVPDAWFSVVPLAADHIERVVADDTVLRTHGLDRMPFLLAVGSANPTKRLEQLVRAWAALGRSTALLVIAGGANAQVFGGAALPPTPGVIALGPVDDATLKALYATAAGLVFPSCYEGFGLPPLEAMACGCPVTLARAASLPEVAGDAALWFAPDDDQALQAAMATLLDDAALRADLRRRGPVRAAQFRWDRSAQVLLDRLAPGGRP